MAKKKAPITTPTGYRKELIQILQRLAYRHDLFRVFSDFVEMAACTFSNPLDLVHRAEREARYMDIVKGYSREEVELFSCALGALTEAYELGGFDDVLGGIFMELELSNSWKGQFFTPYSLCQMMARINLGDTHAAQIESKGYITVNDPAVGSGAMIIAMAEAVQERGFNYQKCMHVIAQDIDIRAVHMTYVQFCLLHIPAVVIHGNTLAVEERSHWMTPAHFMGAWSYRLRNGERTAAAAPAPQPQNEPQIIPEIIPAPPAVADARGQFSLFGE